MSGDLTDARAALTELLGIMEVVNGSRRSELRKRCRPLLEPSDAERKLDEIRARINCGGEAELLIGKLIEILNPPHAPQVVE